MINKLEVIGSILPLNWELSDVESTFKRFNFDSKQFINQAIEMRFNRSFHLNPQNDDNSTNEIVVKQLNKFDK